MPSLVELVTDCIQAIKESNDVSDKLFQLEQLKEIAFHRDRSLLRSVISSLGEFIVDKSANIRKFLLKLVGEAVRLDLTLFPSLISMISYVLHDPNDSVLSIAVREFKGFYSQMIMMIAEMPLSGKAQSLSDPRHLWTLFGKIQLKFNDIIASTRSETLREACLQMTETVLLFGLPNTASAVDPRAQRVDPRLARSQAVKESVATTDSIPLHHAVINRNNIVTEAEDIFAKALVWASASGPHGYPFSPLLMAALGRLIANVATAKPSNGVNAAKALFLLFTGKGNMMDRMSGELRQGIVIGAHRMLRSATVANAADPDAALQKLRGSLEELERVGFGDKASLGKRDRARVDAEGDGEGDDELEESVQLREAAIRAINTATSSADGSTGASKTDTSGGPRRADKVVDSEVTVLAVDYQRIFDGGEFEKVVGASMGYMDLSFNVLRQLLTSYDEVKAGESGLASFYTLAIRTLLSLVRLEMTQPASVVNTQIVSILSSNPAAKVYCPSAVPDHVELPKSLWLLLCFVVDTRTPELVNFDTSDRTKEATDKLELLTKFVFSYWGQFFSEEEVDWTVDSPVVRYYSNFCLALLARLIQTVALRPLARSFLLSLPSIPPSCMSVLYLLTETGSKPDAAAAKSSSSAHKYRGTRQEALLLLSSVVFSSDRVSSAAALNYVLWKCMSDDFEVRAKAVNTLMNDVVFVEDWCDDVIQRFAIHSAISSCEKEVAAWYQHKQVQPGAALSEDYSRYSVLFAYESFDWGALFEGQFSGLNASAAAAADGDKEVDIKKSFHLLLQLCAQNKLNIGSLVDFHCACSGNEGSHVAGVLLSELKNLITAITEKEAADSVVDIIVDFAVQHDEAVARKLLVELLDTLYHDFGQLPTEAVIKKVMSFTLSYGEHGADAQPLNLLLEENFKLMIPVLSGFSTKEVQASLPRFLKLYEDPETLKVIFNKITKARPPVLTKIQLLTELHRINAEAEALKPKSVLDAIAVCLNAKTEYSSEVIKEVLKALLTDEVPALPLMRTAILASQNFADVRKYVSSDVVPALIRKKVWSTSPKVWEGVNYVIKHFSSSGLKSDSALKAILSVPPVQLKSIVKAAPAAVEHLVGLLSSLTADERNEVLSGRWIGHTDLGSVEERHRVVNEILGIKQ